MKGLYVEGSPTNWRVNLGSYSDYVLEQHLQHDDMKGTFTIMARRLFNFENTLYSHISGGC